MDVMKNQLAIAQLASCIVVLCGIAGAQTSIAAPEQKFTVGRFGGYRISRNITSLWLASPDRHPLLMVYFHGPNDWYRTPWNIDSKFEKGKPGWAELQSENVTLRLEINPETGEVAVQSRKFKVRESNTFLVLHTGELLVPQEVIPLGVFVLPPSNNKAASLLLLRAHLEVVERINKEARGGDNRSELGKTPYPSLTRPCTPKPIALLDKTPSLRVGTAFLFPPLIARGRLLRSTYILPCRPNPVSSTNVH
jgi:hypothetical protein